MSSHRLFGRQLSRDSEHRTAMRRNLVQSLFEHGKVRTTLPKAKEVQAMAERLITLARTGTLNARRRVISTLCDRRLVDEEQEFTGQTVVQKLFTDIAPRFVDRPGGYSRIIKLPEHRIGDAGDLVLLQLLTEESAPRGVARRSAGLRRKRAEHRRQFASQILKKDKGEKKGAETAEQSTPPAPAAEASPSPESAPTPPPAAPEQSA
jgi:large subunit ribosomal protein L17